MSNMQNGDDCKIRPGFTRRNDFAKSKALGKRVKSQAEPAWTLDLSPVQLMSS
jgi:hypothetical protein